jgi:hypothetical protein
MDNLPIEIQELIISKADVPIDTYLYYRKVGAIPKKLKLENYDFINKINIRRVKNYKRYIKDNIVNIIDYYGLSDINKLLSISIYMHENIVKISFINYKYINKYLFYKSHIVVDIHTGK